MDQKTIDRINELARKAKTTGLTEQEKEEGNFIPPCTVVVEEQKGGL